MCIRDSDDGHEIGIPGAAPRSQFQRQGTGQSAEKWDPDRGVPEATGMLRAQTSHETQSLKELIWKARKRVLRPDVALPRVPVKRRRLTCAVRSTVRADAQAARRRVPARAGTRPANRSEPENPGNHPASCRSELGGV